jgi:hypothetical protein
MRSSGDTRATTFDFYGFRVTVTGDNDGVLEDVQRDFSYFRSPAGDESAWLNVISEPFPRANLPAVRAALQTPRNIVYRDGDVSYVDYFGRGLMICQNKGTDYQIYCTDRDLAHEIAFLTMLSRVGEHLDARGLHRVHALGIEAGGRAILVLLPMGGGKTTLALRLLTTDDIRLLSEDSPLISRRASRRGQVFPFPLRIGVRVGEVPAGVPDKYCRTVQRMEFDPKTLIDIQHFNEKVGRPCPIGAILLGERWLSGTSFVCPVPRSYAIGPFIKNTVVGLGLYQGMEFLLERSGWEVLGKSRLALARFLTSLHVIRRSRVYRFGMSPGVEENADVLIGLARELSSSWEG